MENITATYNALGGKEVSREEIENLREIATKQEQKFIANKLDTLLSRFPDCDCFFIEEVKTKAIEEAPESLLPGIDFLAMPEEEDHGLSKAVSPDDIYQMITKKMIDLVEKANEKDYKKEWQEKFEKSGYLIPFNFKSKKPYRGINLLMLSVFGTDVLENPFYFTFKQIEEFGGRLKKGSVGEEVIYFTKLYKYQQENPKLDFGTYDVKKFINWVKKNKKSISVLNGKKPLDIESFIFQNSIPILKYYNVFNGKDITGIDFKLDEFKKGYVSKDEENTDEKIDVAEAIANNYPEPKIEIKHGGDRAFFTPSGNYIQMPKYKDFNKGVDYYRTLFHEIIHSTGHKSRLDRVLNTDSQSLEYAREEIIAEFGAVFLSAEAGIIWYLNKNHAAYIKGWKGRVDFLKEDNKLLMRSASAAQKAADFVLNKDKNGKPAYLKDLKVTAKSEKKDKKPTNKIVGFMLVDNITAETVATKKTLPELKKVFLDNAKDDFDTYDMKPLVYEIVKKGTKNVPGKKIDVDWKIEKKPTPKTKATKVKSTPKVDETTGQIALLGATDQINISTEKFNDLSKKELRHFLLNYYNAFLKGKTIAIKKSIQKVELLNRAGKKIAKGSAIYKAKAAVIENFEEVIKNSTYNNWGKPKANDSKDLLGYMNFKSKVMIDGEKRHVRISVEVFKDRRTLLKSYELGQKKKPNLPNESPKKLSSSVKKTSSRNKNTKIRPIPKKNNKGLSCPDPEPKHQEEEKTDISSVPHHNPNSLAARMQQQKNRSFEYYQIGNAEIAKFLGEIEIKEKDSIGISITAPQGAGKTRFAFQLIDAFAANYKVGHASLEEHPESKLYFDKVEEYINPANLQNIEAPEVTTTQGLHNLIMRNDVIVIDSFEKLKEIDSKFEVDKDLRKKYDGKLFIIIFQLTSNGKMRGGSKSQFDVDIVLFTEKFDDYRENYVYPDKNRYNHIPVTDLKYNIFDRKLISDNTEEPTPEAQPKISEPSKIIITEMS